MHPKERARLDFSPTDHLGRISVCGWAEPARARSLCEPGQRLSTHTIVSCTVVFPRLGTLRSQLFPLGRWARSFPKLRAPLARLARKSPARPPRGLRASGSICRVAGVAAPSGGQASVNLPSFGSTGQTRWHPAATKAGQLKLGRHGSGTTTLSMSTGHDMAAHPFGSSYPAVGPTLGPESFLYGERSFSKSGARR